MKKVYIPTEEELQQLNYLTVDTYKYLLAKTVEAIIMEDVIYDETNMLDVTYEELSEFKELTYAIAKIYPEKIALSKNAKKDIELCRLLTSKLSRCDNSSYQLDVLAYFDLESSVISDNIVIQNTIKNLSEHLTRTPRYRFDYKEPNILLDNIYACEIPTENISTKLQYELLSIDPIYITKLGLDLDKEKINYSQNKSFYLSRGLTKYANRYHLENIDRTNQQEKAKKLIRYLDSHKQNYHI